MSLLNPEDRTVLHLSAYKINGKTFDLPIAMSREEIAKSIGVHYSHISRHINKLKEKGYLQMFSGRAKGKSRKQNFYLLTADGKKYANLLTKRLKDTQITVLGFDVGPKRLGFCDVSDYLRERNIFNFTELDICKFTSQQGVLQVQDVRENVKREYIDFTLDIPKITSFYGREKEMNRLEEWIIDKEKHNIIFIYGMPGIGKTTLAAKLIETYRGSKHLFWHNFHEFDSLRGVLFRLAEFLSKLGHDHLKMHLRSRTSLDYYEVSRILGKSIGVIDAFLIFDNFHRSNDEIRKFFVYIYRMLASSSKTNLLILSREIVPSYDGSDIIIGNTIVELKLEGLDFESSKRLLKEKGIDERRFEEMYKSTAGNPLFLGILGGSKDRIERYVHDELYSMLDEDERKILRIISIYRFPVPEDCLAMNVDIDFEKLYALTRKSLLIKNARGRYFAHDFINEFFYSRLSPSEKRKHHQFAARWYEKRDEPMDLIEAIYHYLQGGDYKKASQIAIDSSGSILDSGYVGEFLFTLETFDEKNLETKDWAEILIVKGKACDMSGEWEKALQYLNEGADIAFTIGNKKLEVKAICESGLILEEQNQFDEAMDCFKKALDISKSADYLSGIGEGYRGIGRVYWRKSKHKEAILNFEECIEISKNSGDLDLMASVYIDLGNVYDERYEIEKAIECYNKSLDILEKVKNTYETGRAYLNLAITYQHKEEFNKAIEYVTKQLELAQNLNDIKMIGYGYADISYCFAKIDEFEKAREYAEKAGEIALKIDSDNIMFEVYKTKGLICNHEDKWDDAVKFFQKSIAIAEKQNALYQLPDLHFELGLLYKEVGDSKNAKKHFDKAVNFYNKLGLEKNEFMKEKLSKIRVTATK